MPSLVQDPSNQRNVLAAMPDAVATAGAGDVANEIATASHAMPTGDERSGGFLFQPDASLDGVLYKSILHLEGLGKETIREGLEAAQVVMDRIVNRRVRVEGVQEPRGHLSRALRRPWRLQGTSGRRVWLGTCACSSRGPDVLTLKSAKLSVLESANCGIWNQAAMSSKSPAASSTTCPGVADPIASTQYWTA